jgi:hypothetical protein
MSSFKEDWYIGIKVIVSIGAIFLCVLSLVWLADHHIKVFLTIVGIAVLVLFPAFVGSFFGE